ncbi:unnamed protein product [Spodoptera exigua]|nr:unnamed protein product [Spodoptera exigua]
MNRAKFILGLLQEKEEKSMQITLPELDDDASKTLEVDDLFLNKDLYESAPPSEQIYPKLPSIKPPNSAPLLTDTGNDVVSLEDFLSEKYAPSEQQLQNPPKSPFSDISGIKPLDSSSEPDLSDSGDSWYPDSEENSKKKKQVIIRSSSTDSSDFCDYSKRKKYNKTQQIEAKPGCSKDSYGYISNNSLEDLETESNQQQNTETSLITVKMNHESVETNDQQSSSTASISNEKQLQRWKKSDPSKWKKNIAKINRHKCLPYHGKKGNIMQAKKPKHVNCIVKCRYQCMNHFSEDDRVKLCKDYWKINDNVSQKQFLLHQIVAKPIKTMKTGIPNEKHRSATYEYYFTKDDQQHRVCKDFFLKTLCISKGPVNEAIKYKNEFGNYEGQDRRGSRAPINKTDAASEQKIIDHINSFPRLESHYCRKKSKRQYLDSKLSISKMYELYKEELVTAGEEPCSFYVYKRIFGSQFNLSFFKPKKDLCIICTRYDSSGRPESLKEEYDAHIARKNAAQDAKEFDKQRSMKDDTYLVVTADMQSTLHIPVSGVGILYYTRKLNVQNYTIHTAKPPNEAFCITWNEINGKRGSIEIASAMNWWIHQIPTCVKEVTIYSDTCAGQNRNKFITAFLCHLIARTDVHVEILEQKYLESGHTHMEVDSMYSAIEKCQRHTPVFSMIDWKSIMVRARSTRHKKSSPPYIVKEMTYNDMIDIKALSEHFVKNTSKDKEGNKIMWLKIKCLRFEKGHPGLVKFRYTHDGPYSEFDVFQTLDKVAPRATRRTKRSLDGQAIEENDREGRKEMIDKLKEYVIPKAYSSPIPISEAKKKDLLNLCTKGIIPQELHSWYETLPTSKDIIDRLCEPDVAEEGENDLDF